ncbi:MAG: GIY-YIG nuclease family protein [Flavobacteriales bacterium]
MKFKVYIIYSKSNDVFYKGITEDLSKRLNDHNCGKSTYTKGKEPWVLVFVRTFSSKGDGLRYEKMLKRQNRGYLEWLIKSDKNEIG